MDQAETYELNRLTKKNYESAIGIMFNSESISIGGEIVPREIVRRWLENISYEHIVYVDNNMPRKIVNGNLKYTIRPIQDAVEYFHQQQMKKFQEDLAREKAQKMLEEYEKKHPKWTA